MGAKPLGVTQQYRNACAAGRQSNLVLNRAPVAYTLPPSYVIKSARPTLSYGIFLAEVSPILLQLTFPISCRPKIVSQSTKALVLACQKRKLELEHRSQNSHVDESATQ